MFKHWETFVVIGAGILLEGFLSTMIGSVLDPVLTNLKFAPYNG